MNGLLGWFWAHRVVISALVAVVFGLGTAYVVWAVQDLPDPSVNVLAAGDIVVLDRNGQVIEDYSPAGHYHVDLTLDQMGKYAPKAVLAAEDRNFYQHGAIDVASTLRALWVDVTNRGLNEGGSTITQQLVKIQLLTPEKSLPRKLHELVLAVALEQRFSKDQILTMYLNRVYFGHGAYGVGAAARTYFGKDAKDLTAAQAAFLAGLIQAPSAYDPVLHFQLASGREQYVLRGMVDTHALSQRRQKPHRLSQRSSWAGPRLRPSANSSRASRPRRQRPAAAAERDSDRRGPARLQWIESWHRRRQDND